MVPCSWLELAERLQLGYIKDKALAFIQQQFRGRHTQLLLDRRGLGKLQHSTQSEIYALVPLAMKALPMQLCCLKCDEFMMGNCDATYWECEGCGQEIVVKFESL